MTTIAEVRDSLAETITKGAGLRSYPYLTSSIQHPCCHVRLGEYDPRYVLGKSRAEYMFRVTVFVGPASERSAQIRCDRLREASGEGSLVAAIEDESLWVADVDYAAVVSVGEPDEVVVAEETLMMFDLSVEVVF